MTNFEPLPIDLSAKIASTVVSPGVYVVADAQTTLGKLNHDEFWSPWIKGGQDRAKGDVFSGAWEGLAAVGFFAPEVRQPLASNYYTPLNMIVAGVSLELLERNGVKLDPVVGGEVSIGGGFFPVVEFSEPTTFSREKLGRGKLRLQFGELTVEAKE